jgi:hypothetical protein
MNHPIRRVRDFRIVGPYTLDIMFDDGSDRVIDFRPVLRGELFGPLQDLDLFNRVIVDREVHTLVWPNGADFDPETLRDWPNYVAALTERARNWKPQPVELLK